MKKCLGNSTKLRIAENKCLTYRFKRYLLGSIPKVYDGHQGFSLLVMIFGLAVSRFLFGAMVRKFFILGKVNGKS